MTAKRSTEKGADLESYKLTVLEIMNLLDAGEVTADKLRARAQEVPNGDALLPWIDLAEMLCQSPKQNEAPRPVKNPRFRKGTGMQPAAWSDCLWQPRGK